jgi:hypothetical protein
MLPHSASETRTVSLISCAHGIAWVSGTRCSSAAGIVASQSGCARRAVRSCPWKLSYARGYTLAQPARQAPQLANP